MWLNESQKTRMSRTIPALVTERLTDAIAMLLLAGVGITTYAADKVEYLIVLGVITALGLLILANKTYGFHSGTIRTISNFR